MASAPAPLSERKMPVLARNTGSRSQWFTELGVCRLFGHGSTMVMMAPHMPMSMAVRMTVAPMNVTMANTTAVTVVMMVMVVTVLRLLREPFNGQGLRRDWGCGHRGQECGGRDNRRSQGDFCQHVCFSLDGT